MTLDDALSAARELDRHDPLREFRHRFEGRDGTIYLDGNSLGRLPKATKPLMHDLVERQWGERLVRGWGEGWIDLPQRLGRKIAPIIGAREDEVVACDSTSVNFYKLAYAALEQKIGRNRIVTDDANFPSDLYLMQGVARAFDRFRITVVGTQDGVTRPEAIEASLGSDVALLSLSHVAFKSGQLHDLNRLTRSAQRVGATVLWDLSHSAGAVPIDLAGCRADLAVGCGYKYLNGGPGAPAFLYVRRDLQTRLRSPIWGWFGQRNPFDFGQEYVPAEGIARFLAGTPPVLSMAALEPGLDLILEAGMDAIREKSVRQTEILIDLVDRWLAPLGVAVTTPRDAAERGSHVSISHWEAWRVNQALIDQMNVIPDFREPDCVRFGVAPLYTSYEEIVQAVERTRLVLEEGRFEKYPAERMAVT